MNQITAEQLQMIATDLENIRLFARDLFNYYQSTQDNRELESTLMEFDSRCQALQKQWNDIVEAIKASPTLTPAQVQTIQQANLKALGVVPEGTQTNNRL